MDKTYIDLLRQKLASLNFGPDWQLDTKEMDNSQVFINLRWHNRGTMPGATMFATAQHYGAKGKVYISCSMPRDSKGVHHREVSDSDSEIGVSETKTIQQIETDVQHRLMPEIAKGYALVKAHIDSAEAYYKRKSATGQLAQATMPSLVLRDLASTNDNRSDVSLHSPYGYSPSLHIEANGSGAKLTIDCTDSQMVRILQCIKGITVKDEEQ